MAPRFPQEIFDLIADECASDGMQAWPYVPREDICGGSCYYLKHGFVRSCQVDEDPKYRRPRLTRLSLVSKAWYYCVAKYVWWGVTLSDPEALHDLRDILMTKPELVKLIKHVALHSIMEMMEWEDETILEELASLLAPSASFMIFCHDDEHETIIHDGSWDENRLLVRSITPFCHSNRLTSLFYGGGYFPTQLLLNVPNLRDLALHRAAASGPAIIAHPQGTFRLKRAHFSELSNSVYETLIRGIPKTFSELEKVIFEESTYPEERVDEDQTARILLLAKDAVQQVYIGRSSPISCKRSFLLSPCSTFGLTSFDTTDLQSISRDGSTEFRKLTHPTFKLEAQFFSRDQWVDLERHFDQNLVLCPNLRHLTIFIYRLEYHSFIRLRKADHIVWNTMRKYLGPDRYPALEKVDIGATYTGLSHEAYFCSIDEDLDVELDLDDRFTNQALEAVQSCFPSWEGDTRKMSISFKIDYCEGS